MLLDQSLQPEHSRQREAGQAASRTYSDGGRAAAVGGGGLRWGALLRHGKLKPLGVRAQTSWTPQVTAQMAKPKLPTQGRWGTGRGSLRPGGGGAGMVSAAPTCPSQSTWTKTQEMKRTPSEAACGPRHTPWAEGGELRAALDWHPLCRATEHCSPSAGTRVLRQLHWPSVGGGLQGLPDSAQAPRGGRAGGQASPPVLRMRIGTGRRPLQQRSWPRTTSRAVSPDWELEVQEAAADPGGAACTPRPPPLPTQPPLPLCGGRHQAGWSGCSLGAGAGAAEAVLPVAWAVAPPPVPDGTVPAPQGGAATCQGACHRAELQGAGGATQG